MSITYHEQIYTSAPKLLQEDRGGLGIVAQTRGFPERLSKDLKTICSYRLLDGIPISEPGKHPPLYFAGLRGRAKEYYCVSRVVFAGADHTGRTTPLAHHAVFRLDEMRHQNILPSEILSKIHGEMKDKWQLDPAWFPEPKKLLNPNTNFENKFPSEIWGYGHESNSRLFGQFATHMTESIPPKRPIVFVLGTNESIKINQFITELLIVLPFRYQLTGIQTHVFDAAEVNQNTGIVFTYPETPFLIQAMSRLDTRAPLVIDLTALIPTGSKSQDYGNEIEKLIDRGNFEKKYLLEYRELREKLGDITKPERNTFKSALELSRLLEAVVSADDISDKVFDKLENLVQHVAGASDEAKSWVKKSVEQFVDDVANLDLPSQKWKILWRIHSEGKKWPGGKPKAVKLIEKDGIDAVSHLILTGLNNPQVLKFCKNHADYLKNIIQNAAIGNENAIKASGMFLKWPELNIKGEIATGWAIACSCKNSNPSAVENLKLKLLEFLKLQIKSNPHLKFDFKPALKNLLSPQTQVVDGVVFELLELCRNRDEFQKERDWIDEKLKRNSTHSYFEEYKKTKHSPEIQLFFETGESPSQNEVREEDRQDDMNLSQNSTAAEISYIVKGGDLGLAGNSGLQNSDDAKPEKDLNKNPQKQLSDFPRVANVRFKQKLAYRNLTTPNFFAKIVLLLLAVFAVLISNCMFFMFFFPASSPLPQMNKSQIGAPIGIFVAAVAFIALEFLIVAKVKSIKMQFPLLLFRIAASFLLTVLVLAAFLLIVF